MPGFPHPGDRGPDAWVLLPVLEGSLDSWIPGPSFGLVGSAGRAESPDAWVPVLVGWGWLEAWAPGFIFPLLFSQGKPGCLGFPPVLGRGVKAGG